MRLLLSFFLFHGTIKGRNYDEKRSDEGGFFMEKREQKKRGMQVKKLVAFFLLVFLLLGEIGGLESYAANQYGTFVGRKPSTYTINGDSVYFYPKKIYYSGNKVVCYVYVVNKTGKKIVGLSDTTLTIRDHKKKVVAKHTFKKKKNITIKNNKYKTVKYVFPKKSVKKKTFNFGNASKMSIKASFTFHR